MKRLRIRLFAFTFVLVLAVSSVGSFLFPKDVRAADFWGGTRAVGYFNCFFGLNAFHYDNIAGHGKVIPSSIWKDGVAGRVYSNSDEFVARLKALYATGGQNSTGVAFLVKSMLGYGFCPGGNQGPSTDRSISTAQWNDFQARLKAQNDAGNINWNTYYSSPTTTLGSNKFVGKWGGAPSYTHYKGYDVAAVNYAQADTAIIINNPSGGQIVIFYSCGNPPADKLPALPAENFQLAPSISVTPKAAEPGAHATVTALVNNSGSTSSRSAQWVVNTFTLSPGDSAVPAGGPSTKDPAAYYGRSLKLVTGSSRVFTKGNTALTVPAQTIPDLPVGTKIYYTLSVQPRSHNNTEWNHSTPAYIVISKKPKVQILGGDLSVGRGSVYNGAAVSGVNTSTSTKSGLTYGSWAEYGIIASGTVTGMASGSGYVGGATANLCALSMLTFTSGSSGSGCGTIGRYVQATIAPNVSARFPINVLAADATPSKPADPSVMPTATLNVPNASVNLTANNLSGQYQVPKGVTNNLTITGGTIPKGRSIIINAPDTTITLTGDIRYTTETLGSMEDIPQVVLIGKNIIIADSVSQVDAWLVAVGKGADGRVNTCGAGGVSVASDLTYTQCTALLTINGPIIANQLVLRRTAGSGTGAASGAPAEMINLRADAYIWATDYNNNAGRLPTVSAKELPPRF